MSLVGIIANPASGKDIRRLISEAGAVDNRDKARVVRRVLRGMAVGELNEVVLMPDRFGIGAQAVDGLELPFRVRHLDMPVTGTQEDSMRATQYLRQEGATCVVVLGGDGTHRVVAKECGSIPLVALSTGTNNVWPQHTEGTLAGMAAVLIAQGTVSRETAVHQTKRLEVFLGEDLVDIALVDIATYAGSFTGSKAVWEPDRIGELILSTVAPGTLGLSAIGAALPDIRYEDRPGLYLRMGADGNQVMAAIAPGLVKEFSICESRQLSPGEMVELVHGPCVLALDGEREVLISETDRVRIVLTCNGPFRVCVEEALRIAAGAGYFTRNASRDIGCTQK
jgi:predicted polyphosphate/ATP-dependent NAD kinase